jgi:hypothetical protein
VESVGDLPWHALAAQVPIGLNQSWARGRPSWDMAAAEPGTPLGTGSAGGRILGIHEDD